MKWRIVGLAAILLLIVVVAVVLARSGRAPRSPVPPVPTVKATYTLPTALPSPTATQKATPTAFIGNPTPLPTLVMTPAPTFTPVGGTVVPMLDFELAFQIRGSGFGRTVDASFNNTGTVDAHNIKATLQLWAGSSRIKVNGQDMLVESLGDLAAGATVSRTITITVTFLDGIRVQSSGGTITVDVVCDEGSKQFRFAI